MGLRIFHNEFMARKQPFALDYDEVTKEHLRAIPTKYHALIRKVVEEQLLYEPETETLA